MSDSSGEKSEEATDKKLEDSRKKGQVWKSRDFTGVMVFLVGMMVLKWTWGNIQGEVTHLFHSAIDFISHPHNLHEAILGNIWRAGGIMLYLSLPILGACMALGLTTEFLQVGPLLSMEAIEPKLEKLNPIEGMKNLFSKKQLVEFLKSSFKMTLAGYVVYGVVKGQLRMVTLSVRGDAEMVLAALAEMVYSMTVRVGLLFTLFGIFDLWFQRHSYMKDMMMTKDEVKREYKESEGDPHHKAKRKELHMEILESAQMDSVKSADVVVTNPDHVSVALQYDPLSPGAPRVLVKGTDALAQAIKVVARDAGIPVMRNVPLARALLEVEVGEEIPEPLFDGVAEVLNFVHSLHQRAGAPV